MNGRSQGKNLDCMGKNHEENMEFTEEHGEDVGCTDRKEKDPE